jgi:hypothetical protein
MNEATQQPPPMGKVTAWKSEPWTVPDNDPKGIYIGNDLLAYAHSRPEAARIASAHNQAMERQLALTLGALEAARG